MSETIQFLSVEQVLAIHQRVIDEFGGSAGLRDRGLLESAVAMPMATFGGEFLHDGVPAKAAAYLFHLCRNHAFVDGNKPAALASALVFLVVNGRRMAASKAAVEALTLRVADGSLTKDDVTDFFIKHAKRGAPQRARRRRKES